MNSWSNETSSQTSSLRTGLVPQDLRQLREMEQPVGVPGRPVGIVTVDDAVDDVVCFASLVEERGHAGS